MQCSPPASFTGVSMSSIAIYSSLTFIPAIVSGVAPQITGEKAYGACRDTFCGSFAASGEGPVGDAGFRGIEIPEKYTCPELNAHYREIPMKITTSRPLRKHWTPYAELQRCKTDGWKGLQEQRRASGACGMG